MKEITAKELDAACRKGMYMVVSDVQALSRALDERRIEYAVASEYEADVFGKWSVTDLVQALSKQGCTVNKITERDESLESYYINLIGGGSHE